MNDIMYLAFIERVGPDDVIYHTIGYFKTKDEAIAKAKDEVKKRGAAWDWSVDRVRVLERIGEYIIAIESEIRWSSYAGMEVLS